MNKTIIIFLLFVAMINCGSTGSPQSKLRPGKDYALFFAVNDYQPGSGFEDLGKPVENAEAVAKELRERYGFQTEVVKNPTLDQIGAKLREYQSFYARNPQGKYPSTGQLLIYFTGHGISEDNNGYFVPSDGNIKKLYSTAFAYEIWRPFINKIDCRHILVAIDACYSVTFDPDWYSKKMDPSGFKRPGELSEGDKLLLANESDKCRIVFTSDGSEDKVPERSNFARKFIEGLRSGVRQDGILTSETLAGYLRFAAPIPRLSEFGDDQKGSFLFIQTVAVAPKNVPGPDETASLEKDLMAWRAAKSANTIAAYTDYLNRFANGEFREQAQAGIRAIEQDLALRRDDLAWQVAEEKNTEEAYKKYQADFPNGRHAMEVSTRIRALAAVEVSGSVASDGLVYIEGGTFDMGCTSEQKDCEDNELPVHKVTLSSFYMGQFEVTQKQWRNIMGTSPSHFTGCDDCPVEQVSWDDVQEYIKKLNSKTGRTYRLPTEAEWEYAARAGGKKVLFGNGKNTADPSEINFEGDNNVKAYSVKGVNRQKTTAVGSFKPNQFNLYDMSGNVAEWCSDWRGDYPASAKINPPGPSTGTIRTLRGGSWTYEPKYCRTACRDGISADYRGNFIGFRLVRSK